MTTQEIIEVIKGLSVLELNELVKACEEEFGVSAAAGVVVAGAVAGGAAEEEKIYDGGTLPEVVVEAKRPTKEAIAKRRATQEQLGDNFEVSYTKDGKNIEIRDKDGNLVELTNGKTGCYAIKNGDKYTYYDANGNEISEEEVQKKDPNLWNQAGWYAPLKLAEEPKKQDVDFTKPNNWDNVRLGKQWGQE